MEIVHPKWRLSLVNGEDFYLAGVVPECLSPSPAEVLAVVGPGDGGGAEIWTKVWRGDEVPAD